MSTPSSHVTDEDWFRQLFANAYRPLVAYARRRSATWGDADDVVSEVFTIAWRRRAERDPERPVMPWLYGIAANVGRNQWRSAERRLRLQQHLETQPEPVPTDDPAERPGADVRAALAELSLEDQEVLRLAAWEGLTHAEIGEVLGCSTNAVGIRTHRARLRLRAQLEQTDRPGPRSPAPGTPQRDDPHPGPDRSQGADPDGETT